MKKFLLFLCFCAMLIGCKPQTKKTVVRVGFFPNITHAHALVAQCMARHGDDWFAKRCGAQVQWFPYNAGPSAMEAILASSIDLTYVGPNPALNAYQRSKGEEIRYIAGAVKGGAALVVSQEIQSAQDLLNKRIATPQLGNTQDVACRLWLMDQGFAITLQGGDCEVLPTPNANQLDLFQRGDIAGVWTVEPWVSRLLKDGNGKILIEQEDAITTILVSRRRFLEENQQRVRSFLKAHQELTQWIRQHPEEAQQMVVEQIGFLTQGKISSELVREAWKRLKFDDAPDILGMEAMISGAQRVGFLEGNIVSLKKFFVNWKP
ncbi:MAG: ABC transporter substrate-binding protein [Verrucomicrobiota bacterium]